ncbi:GMC oxidoreductase [Ruania zhangjianzhongii]|uniref:GMC oxidoreductase n=1 Tax=Ruania zhangjianzhongii TaxID=2603206 RepID=UPI0011CA2E5E|nr:GMC oxidoreductase [Ruania zhangjianzhongii]
MTAPPPGPAEDYACCVVGAGPVGLTFAMEAANAGARVLLIDAGNGESARRPISSLSGQQTHIVDPDRHAPLEQAIRRGIGGTSQLWGGRCVALEPIDLAERDYVPGGEWPITLEDVVPWYRAAARHLDCGPPVFRSEAPDWPGLSNFEMSNLERWSRQPRLDPGLGARVLAHPQVTTLLDTRLADLEIDADGSIAAVVAEHNGARIRLHADQYVLAMGGLEIPRLLLEVQRRLPTAFGGIDGPLGRFYMGHTTGSIAEIVLDDPAQVVDLDFVRDGHDSYVRRRFTLSEEAQRENRVLNTSFYLDNPAFYEYEHHNATLSAVFLAMAIPPIGRRIVAERMRLRHIGPRPYRVGMHLRNILRHPWRIVADVVDIIRRRYLSPVRKPGFILRNDSGRYAVHYHAEQLPNPDSRVMMHTSDDGEAVLDVDYRYLEADIDSVLRCHELLDADLRSAGLGRLEYLAKDPAGIRALAWEQAVHGLHSIGTTRMSRDPAAGVVDADLRVHGTRNLFLASTSVFPTSAEANPTFFAAALAVRLAHHLVDARPAIDDTAVSKENEVPG